MSQSGTHSQVQGRAVRPIEGRVESRVPSYVQGGLDSDSVERSLEAERSVWESLVEFARRLMRRASPWKGI